MASMSPQRIGNVISWTSFLSSGISNRMLVAPDLGAAMEALPQVYWAPAFVARVQPGDVRLRQRPSRVSPGLRMRAQQFLNEQGCRRRLVLLHQARAINIHRSRADGQPLSDLLARQPFDQQCRDL